MYNYRAKVLNIVDGDTVDVMVDLGFNITHLIRIRLNNIDCPETRTRDLLEKEHGLKAKDFVINKIMDQEVTIKTFKDSTGKYGRFLADIYYFDNGVEFSLVEQLKEFGFEKQFTYTIH